MSARRGESEVTEADRRVLRQLAGHAATAVEAAASAIELRLSREQRVMGREEERRPLRQDLHDGLGPLVTDVAFATDAAINIIGSSPDEARRLLTHSRV